MHALVGKNVSPFAEQIELKISLSSPRCYSFASFKSSCLQSLAPHHQTSVVAIRLVARY
jgi:hypothetical protein